MKQTDIYTEALSCLRLILLADHPEFENWIDWLERDIEDWTQRREVAHHLRAYGGMGSFNDLPSMRGNHDYIFGFLKSVCYAFGHLYGKREGVSPEALMEECVRGMEQEDYYCRKELNQAIALHQVLGNGLVQCLMGVIGCLLYIVQALLHQCLRRNAFPFAIKMAEGIAHGLEKAENIVVISTHTGQVVERAHTSVCPKMVGNLPLLVPVLNVPLQPADPVFEFRVVCL